MSAQNYFIDLLAKAGVTELAVASTDEARSYSFPLPKDAYFSVELLFESAAAVDVKVEMEIGNVLPTTEGSSDSNFVVGDTVSTGVTVETVQFLATDPPVAKYGRLLFTGQGSNAASTKLTRIRICVSKNK